MTSPDILYLFRQSIIQLCGSISYVFFFTNLRHSWIFASHIAHLDQYIDQYIVTLKASINFGSQAVKDGGDSFKVRIHIHHYGLAFSNLVLFECCFE